MSKLLKSILKIAFPAFGQSLDFDCATKQCDVALLAGVEQRDIAYRDTILAFFDQFDRISRSDLTLFQDGKIKAGALARQKPLDDISAAKFDAQLVTGKPRLGHHDNSRADTILVTDIELRFEKSRAREVLAEHAPG